MTSLVLNNWAQVNNIKPVFGQEAFFRHMQTDHMPRKRNTFELPTLKEYSFAKGIKLFPFREIPFQRGGKLDLTVTSLESVSICHKIQLSKIQAQIKVFLMVQSDQGLTVSY